MSIQSSSLLLCEFEYSYLLNMEESSSTSTESLGTYLPGTASLVQEIDSKHYLTYFIPITTCGSRSDITFFSFILYYYHMMYVMYIS